jgi:hypothetical protein
MDSSLKYVSGKFSGNFYTHQKSPLSAGEKIPTGALHDVHLFQGELTDTVSIESFDPREHLNRDGMLLHNITNIQIHQKSVDSNDKKIYDFDQFVLKNVKVESSWEQNGKTYGVLNGELVGKVKKTSKYAVNDDNNQIIPPPPPNGGNSINPIPIDGGNNGWDKYIPPLIKDHNGGCFSSIWNILKWILLFLLIMFLFKQCESCEKNKTDTTKNECCLKVDSLKILKDSIENELNILKENQYIIDSLQNEIENRRKREKGRIGEITVSLIWETSDDLDIAVEDPNGDWIYYEKNENQHIQGKLDIDANRDVSEILENPIENIYINKPIPGRYKVHINWYTNRTKQFEVSYYMQVKNGENVIDFNRVVYENDQRKVKRNWETIYEFDYNVK